MFLQRKGQVIMTIELLDTEEAQTEDPLEVQVRTAALCSVPWTHHGGQGQPQAASWGSHHGSPCTCWPSTSRKTSTREASVQAECSPWKRIRRWELPVASQEPGVCPRAGRPCGSQAGFPRNPGSCHLLPTPCHPPMASPVTQTPQHVAAALPVHEAQSSGCPLTTRRKPTWPTR